MNIRNVNIEEIKSKFFHFPVMYREVLDFFFLVREKPIVVDATLGGGGHSYLLCRSINDGTFIAFDRDIRMIHKTMEFFNRENIRPVVLNQNIFDDIDVSLFSGKGFYIVNKRFSNIKNVLQKLNLKADFLICDLGISMYHLKEDWGFSMNQSNLDMRLDETSYNILDILNSYSEKELADIIYQYGEERFSRYIAKEIIRRRPIKNAIELKEIVIQVYFKKLKKYINEKVVQKTFQAFRIYINQELEELKLLLKDLKDILNPNGIAVFISFHSLEDRLIKNAFKDLKNQGFVLLTKKPLTPKEDELNINSASHSAKVRAVQCKV
jgi:16S rRNA (cytosine1402-N4)-methyltransferase